MANGLRLVRVLAVLGMVFVLSCSVGQRERGHTYASGDVDVFLAGLQRAIVAHDTALLLAEYIDPTYRREQLEELLEGNQRQFFDELFGLGENRFEDIAALEFVGDKIHFEPFEYGAEPDVQLAQIPVLITYKNGVQIEDWVFLLKHAEGDRMFTLDGPRG